MKVLALEDRPGFLGKLAEAILAEEWEGRVHLTMTTSVEQAKVLVAGSKWDLAFLDHDLPDGSGWQVLNSIRWELGKEVDFPVYGTSSLPEHNKRIVEHGGIGSVAKMEGADFVPRVREIVRGRLRELEGEGE